MVGDRASGACPEQTIADYDAPILLRIQASFRAD
jgi:hypothetical protein